MALLVFFLCRPIIMRPPEGSGGVVVPILVDGSRSMRVADVDGRPRIERAVSVLERELASCARQRLQAGAARVRRSGRAGRVAVRGGGHRATNRSGRRACRGARPLPRAAARCHRGDFRRRRHRWRPRGRVPAIRGRPCLPWASDRRMADRICEVTGISAGDPRIDQTSVDLRVSAVSRGFGRAGFDLRVLANGRLIESRTLTPAADGAPGGRDVHGVAGSAERDGVHGRDCRRAWRGRDREQRAQRAGQPGRPPAAASWRFRARQATSTASWRAPLPPILASRSTPSCGKGRTTPVRTRFSCRPAAAAPSRCVSGFPATREALYAYDALLVANVEGDFFTRAQLALMADFVAERGGGLLVLGGRLVSRSKGLLGTPLEAVLPLELNDRRGGLVAAELRLGADRRRTTPCVLTPEG